MRYVTRSPTIELVTSDYSAVYNAMYNAVFNALVR